VLPRQAASGEQNEQQCQAEFHAQGVHEKDGTRARRGGDLKVPGERTDSFLTHAEALAAPPWDAARAWGPGHLIMTPNRWTLALTLQRDAVH
jgi:hypothetical protein